MSAVGIWLYKHLNDKVCRQLSVRTPNVRAGTRPPFSDYWMPGSCWIVMTCCTAPVGDHDCFLRSRARLVAAPSNVACSRLCPGMALLLILHLPRL